ncbi:MAG: MBL fold metallo-hydrolase, partial [Actinobacteria bacterium]|nr:MBL fold metallo-hydrolase [Actinomycetota bacterium]
LTWLGTAERAPETVLVVHGEESAAESMRRAVTKELGWTAVAPSVGERFSLRRG